MHVREASQVACILVPSVLYTVVVWIFFFLINCINETLGMKNENEKKIIINKVCMLQSTGIYIIGEGDMIFIAEFIMVGCLVVSRRRYVMTEKFQNFFFLLY